MCSLLCPFLENSLGTSNASCLAFEGCRGFEQEAIEVGTGVKAGEKAGAKQCDGKYFTLPGASKLTGERAGHGSAGGKQGRKGRV